MRGVVRKYKSEKGFGFIHGDGDNHDTFFHISAVNSDDDPCEGDHVEFEPGQHQGRPVAVNVNILEE